VKGQLCYDRWAEEVFMITNVITNNYTVAQGRIWIFCVTKLNSYGAWERTLNPLVERHFLLNHCAYIRQSGKTIGETREQRKINYNYGKTA
jgi:hypothetical protein